MVFKNLFKDYIYPVAVFSGGMIGVGFLSLPYIAMKSGIWIMLAYFFIATFLITKIHLVFCEISLKTPDFKRIPGFVGHYLGKKAEIFTLFLTVIGTFGVLLAYLIVAGDFLTAALQPIFHAGPLVYVFFYFALVTAIIYFDIKTIAKVEFWVLVLLFLSIIFIFLESFSHIKLSNIFPLSGIPLGGTNLFLPYGPMLFALWGAGMIPEVEEMLAASPQGKKRLKKIVVISTIIIAVFYFLFTLLILGLTGAQTDSVALTGLKNVLGSNLVLVSLLIGAAATFTAFVSQGIILKKTLVYDLGIKHWQALVMTCFTPMILFLLGLKNFIPILSFVGAIILGIYGILILLMYKKIACLPAGRAKKNIVIYSLSLVFLLGIIYEIIHFIK
ncbi:MAG: amino acid permease [Candidatus Staskawiczbacteria bacterium]|nr:amino acid permease [Candidatus Staskawiczbacteria bacterium]